MEKHSAFVGVKYEEQFLVDAGHSAMCIFEPGGDDIFGKVYKRAKGMVNKLWTVSNEQPGPPFQLMTSEVMGTCTGHGDSHP